MRIARTCRAMGITSIAVYSDADAEALHVRECDEALRIGPAPARESYLDIGKIVAAARGSRAQAVHPGYGFLSENADFAQACLDAQLIFVGPPPAAMEAVGDKIAAKRTAATVGVPDRARLSGRGTRRRRVRPRGQAHRHATYRQGRSGRRRQGDAAGARPGATARRPRRRAARSAFGVRRRHCFPREILGVAAPRRSADPGRSSRRI